MPLFFNCQLRISLAFLILCFAFPSHSQDSTVYYNASIIGAGATSQTPFWEYANQHGAVPRDGMFGLVDLGISKVYNPNNPRFVQWSGSAEVVGSYGKRGNFFLSDLFGAMKLGPVEILAGQKKMVTGLVDTTFTTGSLSMSGNARPFPRIQISTPNYIPLFFTNNLLSFKLSYSDGYLGPSQLNYGVVREIERTYFHHKSLYLRFGNQTMPFRIYAGFNHQAIWGGEDKIFPIQKLNPSKAYWYTVTGKTFDYKKIGHHFGTLDIGGEWHGKHWSYFLYRQNVYETGSLFRITNIEDGLNGFRVKRTSRMPEGSSYFAFHSFLVEVLGTHNQINASPLSGLVLYERGNYYNSFVYQRGWSYFGNSIGTPLIPAAILTRDDLPRSNSEFTNNNRLWAFHGSTTATWAHLNFGLRGVYSRNAGTFVSSFDHVAQQISLMLSVEKKLKAGSVFARISSDIGDLYPDTHGIMVGLRRGGFLD